MSIYSVYVYVCLSIRVYTHVYIYMHGGVYLIIFWNPVHEKILKEADQIFCIFTC